MCYELGNLNRCNPPQGRVWMGFILPSRQGRWQRQRQKRRSGWWLPGSRHQISPHLNKTWKNMKNTCLLRWVCPAHFAPCGLRQCGGQDWGMLPGHNERGHSSSEAETVEGCRRMSKVNLQYPQIGLIGLRFTLVAGRARFGPTTTRTRPWELVRFGGSVRCGSNACSVRPLDCKPYVTMLPYVTPDHASAWGLRWLGGGWVWFGLIRYDSVSMSCHAIFTHSLSTRTGRNWCTTSTRRSRRVMAPSWSFSQDGVLTATRQPWAVPDIHPTSDILNVRHRLGWHHQDFHPLVPIRLELKECHLRVTIGYSWYHHRNLFPQCLDMFGRFHWSASHRHILLDLFQSFFFWKPNIQT